MKKEDIEALRHQKWYNEVADLSIEQRHAVRSLPKKSAQVPAVDIFGNPLTTKTLTPEVAYFTLDHLPKDWDAQRQVVLLSFSRLSNLSGGTVTIEIQAPDRNTTIKSLNTPPGVTIGQWTRNGDILSAPVTSGLQMAAGTYGLQPVAIGNVCSGILISHCSSARPYASARNRICRHNRLG